MKRSILAITTLCAMGMLALVLARLLREPPARPFAQMAPSGAEAGTGGQAPAAGAATGAPAASSAAQRLPRLDLPMPPPGAPLASSFDALHQRAKAGDAQAATRLTRELARCITTNRINGTASVLTRMSTEVLADKEKFDKLDSRQQQQAIEHAEQVQRGLKTAKENAALCEGTDVYVESGAIYEASLMAADLGDHAAALCYARGLYGHPKDWASTTAVQRYRENAQRLMAEGIQRGDWRMAKLMAEAYSSQGGRVGLFRYLNMYDPAQALRYDHLLLLAASDDEKETYQRMIAAWMEQMPNADLAAASAWADRTFKKHFARSGPLASALCEYN